MMQRAETIPVPPPLHHTSRVRKQLELPPGHHAENGLRDSTSKATPAYPTRTFEATTTNSGRPNAWRGSGAGTAHQRAASESAAVGHEMKTLVRLMELGGQC